jgi:hypothetical protein
MIALNLTILDIVMSVLWTKFKASILVFYYPYM